MKNCRWIFLLVVGISAAAQQSTNDWTVIRAGTLIDGKSDKPRADYSVAAYANPPEVNAATNWE